jgi:two-component system chemotaxis response regulator CheB
MLLARDDFEVVAEASNASDALAALSRVRVDIVLLDVEMPGGSGIDALPAILKAGQGARVLIVSSLADDGAEATVRALALGAADTLPKPGVGSFGGRFSDILAERLRRIGRAACGDDGPSPQARVEEGPALRLRAMAHAPLSCLAIGASTGGLHALAEFLKALPPRIGAPILVTQHLPPVFMPFFATQLEAASGRRAVVAEEGMPLRSERIFLAPGDAHLRVVRAPDGGAVVRLTHERVANGCLPSADPMFEAVAETYGAGGLGMVLSGMGRDGAAGAACLLAAGGSVLAQDKATSAVWGMPRAVAEAGLCAAVLPPAALASCVAERVARWS